MNSDRRETLYTPDSIHDQGASLWVFGLREVWRERSLIGILMRRDIVARYRQSLLGYVWIILPPLVAMGVFSLLVSQRVLPFGDTPVPYPVFALWNLSVWYLFSGILLACTNSLVAAGPLVTKLNFAKGALVVAAIGQPLFEFLIRLAPVALLMVWYGVWPGIEILLLPVLLILVVAMALGIGLVLSVLNLLLRDFSSLLAILLTVGVFCAPILFPPAESGPLSPVNVVNPFSPLLIATQTVIFGGGSFSLLTFTGAALLALGCPLFGWWFFNAVLPRAVEQA